MRALLLPPMGLRWNRVSSWWQCRIPNRRRPDCRIPNRRSPDCRIPNLPNRRWVRAARARALLAPRSPRVSLATQRERIPELRKVSRWALRPAPRSTL